MAAASRLVWRVFDEQWGKAAQLVTLLNDPSRARSIEPSTTARLRFGAALAAKQATGRCDWIFYTHLSVARVQAFVPAVVRRPYAVFIHGVEAWRRLTPAQQWVLSAATLRVANSEFTAGRVAEMHPSIGPVMPCPLALPADGQVAREPGAATSTDIGTRAVILVARMSASERYKGHDELLNVWSSVLSQVPDARLVLIGDGDDAPRLKKKAHTLGIARSVIFTGFVSDVELSAYYGRAAVFAMPSRGEGFGMVYLEAMSHRLPCIGSVEDAAGEIIDDGVTGFLVEQSDRPALRDRLVRLLTDAALRAELGGNGYERLQARFTYRQFSRTVQSLIGAAFAEQSAERAPVLS